MSKYGNKRTEVAGITFDSQAEARRYQELALLERVGAISDLRLQPSYVLQPAFKREGKTVRAIVYRADFEYVEAGQRVVEDVKGVRTKDFDLKAKLFMYQHPDLRLFINPAKGQSKRGKGR